MRKFILYGLALLLAAVVSCVLAAAALWLLDSLSLSLKKPAPETDVFGLEGETYVEVEELPDAPTDTGTFTDERDSVIYKITKIGGKAWMAENLRYKTKKSWCYDDDTSNCGKYGRLYGWETAKTVCPAGWHLPTRLEWLALSEAVGGEEATGKRLKAKSGWDENGNGNDWHGFSALPGGNRHPTDGDFSYAGSYGLWWTATEYGEGGGSAYIRTMNYSDNDVGESYNGKGGGLSVRCVQDD